MYKNEGTAVFEFQMASGGVNFHKNLLELGENEAVFSQNLIWKNGMVKRAGNSLLTSTQVVSSKKILGLHRFYYGAASKQLLAACDTTVKYYAGSDVWTNVKTGLTTGKRTHFATWGFNDTCYISNGTDAPHKWTGSASSAVAAAPADTLMFLPYQDRLLSITGGDVTWSASFDDTSWETVGNTGVRPDTKLFGMCYHGAVNTDSGYENKVLLAGANGMYLFYGTDLDVSTGNYVIENLSTSVGCNAPFTMQWTPAGTMWLGIDRQVYLLPVNSVSPIPIGQKIKSNAIGIEGAEKIPQAQIENACATYHDGYYKLSIAPSGQTTNTKQYWLDITRLSQDGDGHWGPWYGPMDGQAISVFANQNGEGDTGELMGGESSTKGYVYETSDPDAYGDIDTSDASAKSIQTYYQTNYSTLSGNDFFRKDVHWIETTLLDVLGTVNVDYHDIEGALKTGDEVSLSGSAEYWDDNYWNDEYWSNSMPVRVKVDVSPAIHARRLSILIKQATSNDIFELYGLSVNYVEKDRIYETNA
jgi:hypothetical protein